MWRIFDIIPIDLTLLLILTFIVSYLYFKHSFQYFPRLNIPILPPTIPLGNAKLSFFHKYGQDLEKLYEEFKQKGCKYGGFYLATKPILLIVDPELVRNILIRDYQYFHARDFYINDKEFITEHLFALSGIRWKNLRTKITPIFTRGKLKSMFHVLLEKTENLEKVLHDHATSKSSFEAKDLCTKITTDMFCALCFGIDCNSLIDPNAEFQQRAKDVIKNDFLNTLKVNFAVVFPNFYRKLNINFIKTDFQNFFIKAMTDIVEYREKNKVDCADFLSLLIKLKNNENIEEETNEKPLEGITMKQLIAQAFVFFVGGFDTSSSTLNYCLYELTQNQDLQNKVREEIHSVLKKNDGMITYDSIGEMKLLDRVIEETLRIYPPLVVLNRKCTQNYTIPGTNSVVEKGTSVMISVLGIHHDEQYFPNPLEFNPDRFLEEEKAKRNSFVYMPFGDGPRNCIGMRLGMLQVKLGIISLLKNHRFKLNPKTKCPLEFKTDFVLLQTDGDMWIDVEEI